MQNHLRESNEYVRLRNNVRAARQNRISAANRLYKKARFVQNLNIYYACVAAVIAILGLTSSTHYFGIIPAVLAAVLSIAVVCLNLQKYSEKASHMSHICVELGKLAYDIEDHLNQEPDPRVLGELRERYLTLIDQRESRGPAGYFKAAASGDAAENDPDKPKTITRFVDTVFGGLLKAILWVLPCAYFALIILNTHTAVISAYIPDTYLNYFIDQSVSGNAGMEQLPYPVEIEEQIIPVDNIEVHPINSEVAENDSSAISGVDTDPVAEWDDPLPSESTDSVISGNVKIRKYLYGCRDNATLLNLNADFVSEDYDGYAAVNGISNNPTTQATYPGNDTVVEFLRTKTLTAAEEINIHAVEYGTNYVIVSDEIPDELQIDSILFAWDSSKLPENPTEADYYNQIYQNKNGRYVGIVQAIDRENKKITVNAWYIYVGLIADYTPPAGQVPPASCDTVTVNPVHKVWLENGNLIVRGSKRGVVAEMDMFGDSVGKEGYDIILNDGGMKYGYRVRSSKPELVTENGFIANTCNNSFFSDSAKRTMLSGNIDLWYYQDDPESKAGTVKKVIETYSDGVSFYGVDVYGRQNIGGSNVGMFASEKSDSTGVLPKRFYATTDAGAKSITLSSPNMLTGVQTSIVVSHDITLTNGKNSAVKLCVAGQSGWKKVDSVSIKAPCIVNAIFIGNMINSKYNISSHGEWYLTVESALTPS